MQIFIFSRDWLYDYIRVLEMSKEPNVYHESLSLVLVKRETNEV